MTKEKVINIPNVLSAYRLVALPFIICAIAGGNKGLFLILLVINLLTDILDGWVARTFSMQTELGAKLDSLADIGTYLMAFSGMIVLETTFVRTYNAPFLIIIALWLLPQVISLLRFRRFPSFHLWSNKAVGYIQGIFIVTYFAWGFHHVYFYFMIVCSCLAYLEELLLVIFIPRLRSNLKSIFLVLKEHKRIQ